MTPSPDLRPPQILARSLARDLAASGLDDHDVLLLAAELLDHVAEHKAIRRTSDGAERHRAA